MAHHNRWKRSWDSHYAVVKPYNTHVIHPNRHVNLQSPKIVRARPDLPKLPAQIELNLPGQDRIIPSQSRIYVCAHTIENIYSTICAGEGKRKKLPYGAMSACISSCWPIILQHHFEVAPLHLVRLTVTVLWEMENQWMCWRVLSKIYFPPFFNLLSLDAYHHLTLLTRDPHLWWSARDWPTLDIALMSLADECCLRIFVPEFDITEFYFFTWKIENQLQEGVRKHLVIKPEECFWQFKTFGVNKDLQIGRAPVVHL